MKISFNLSCSINKDYTKESLVNGYANEYSQVVLNIINNAKDALLENEVFSPTINISTYIQDSKCILKISDNAGGIPEDLIDKIFEPYFTTKGEGDGTGIGLYMSKTIIEEHMNGELSVHNGDDGAVFIVVLGCHNE